MALYFRPLNKIIGICFTYFLLYHNSHIAIARIVLVQTRSVPSLKTSRSLSERTPGQVPM